MVSHGFDTHESKLYLYSKYSIQQLLHNSLCDVNPGECSISQLEFALQVNLKVLLKKLISNFIRSPESNNQLLTQHVVFMTKTGVR